MSPTENSESPLPRVLKTRAAFLLNCDPEMTFVATMRATPAAPHPHHCTSCTPCSKSQRFAPPGIAQHPPHSAGAQSKLGKHQPVCESASARRCRRRTRYAHEKKSPAFQLASGAVASIPNPATLADSSPRSVMSARAGAALRVSSNCGRSVGTRCRTVHAVPEAAGQRVVPVTARFLLAKRLVP